MGYYKGKKVLVTGGSGFIGSHLVRRLVSEGADVSIMVRYQEKIDNVRMSGIWDKLNLIEADVRNLDTMQAVKDLAPQVIFHLAAFNHVGRSFSCVQECFDVNARGTANLLDAYDGYEKFVYTSTSEIYGLQDSVPFVETMMPAPQSPYSVTKYTGELYALMKQRQKDLPIAVIRPFNVFGPYQTPSAVIMNFIRMALNGERLSTDKGEQTREFNFIDNTVDGFLLVGEKDEAIGKYINVGGGEDFEISIADLARKVVEFSGSKSELGIGDKPYRENEIWRMYSDSSKAKELLGWEPKISFDDGLKKTIDWFRKYREEFENKDKHLSNL
ncbi:MAG: NAD-dependent epimerase/dehydratase family protein [Candidatus Diapherotrites archaeon]|jgi:UDP-glucose 4-epimerase|nr:NAD-dependent epimerase/dehydratase family protein [Candidatus Diapherotrites archaeon]MBT4596627.1 NAD-dependent epimerase/dehydratase family protein [Candidatus Diapherotrites archaeon]